MSAPMTTGTVVAAHYVDKAAPRTTAFRYGVEAANVVIGTFSPADRTSSSYSPMWEPSSPFLSTASRSRR